MAKLSSLNQISLNQVDQIKLNKSSGSNNDEQRDSVKLGLLNQVNQNKLSRQIWLEPVSLFVLVVGGGWGGYVRWD